MSHEPGFLKMIRDSVPSGNVRTLQFVRLGEQNSTIGDCDIDDIVRVITLTLQYPAQYLYNNDGKRDWSCARSPLLEAYLRVKLPREFRPTEC